MDCDPAACAQNWQQALSLGSVCDDKKQTEKDAGEWVSTEKMRKITCCHCRWDVAGSSHMGWASLGVLVGTGKKRTVSTGLWATSEEAELSVHLFGTTPGNGHSGLCWKITLKPMLILNHSTHSLRVIREQCLIRTTLDRAVRCKAKPGVCA